jgi:NitT/TauT family transport system substrate-binding protein
MYAKIIAILVSLFAVQVGIVHAEKIIFAYPSPSTSFLPLVVAQKKGFFDAENLQPELVQIRPAVAIPGLTIGSVDYTTVLGSTIAARMRGVPLVITGVFADKPMDFLVGAKGIVSARELKGRIVGISALGTATHFLTVKVLRAVGLDLTKTLPCEPWAMRGFDYKRSAPAWCKPRCSVLKALFRARKKGST